MLSEASLVIFVAVGYSRVILNKHEIANISRYAITSDKNGGTFFSQTEVREENDQELEVNSQTNIQPSDDVVVVDEASSSADAVPLNDNSTEEEQQSNSETHSK